MIIVRSSAGDEPRFREFWDAALAKQKASGIPLWPNYPANLIGEELSAGLHYSVFDSSKTLAGCFSLALADPLIWSEEKGDAIYIHRMCVNPSSRGHGLAGHVLSWAYGFAAGAGRRYVRMDTWRDNKRLVDYYGTCGFRLIGERHIRGDHRLPAHYADIHLALFENDLEKKR
jgi:GNAT superfamily N-acetyltransferase